MLATMRLAHTGTEWETTIGPGVFQMDICVQTYDGLIHIYGVYGWDGGAMGGG